MDWRYTVIRILQDESRSYAKLGRQDYCSGRSRTLIPTKALVAERLREIPLGQAPSRDRAVRERQNVADRYRPRNRLSGQPTLSRASGKRISESRGTAHGPWSYSAPPIASSEREDAGSRI